MIQSSHMMPEDTVDAGAHGFRVRPVARSSCCSYKRIMYSSNRKQMNVGPGLIVTLRVLRYVCALWTLISHTCTLRFTYRIVDDCLEDRV